MENIDTETNYSSKKLVWENKISNSKEIYNLATNRILEENIRKVFLYFNRFKSFEMSWEKLILKKWFDSNLWDILWEIYKDTYSLNENLEEQISSFKYEEQDAISLLEEIMENIWFKRFLAEYKNTKENWNESKIPWFIYFINKFENTKIINYTDLWNNEDDICIYLEKFIKNTENSFSFYEVIVDDKKHIQKIIDKIPVWIKKYFNKEDFTWIRYYVLNNTEIWSESAIWLYWWDTEKWNDYIFGKFISKHNIKKQSFKLTDLIDYLE